jgi:hypothetical protein
MAIERSQSLAITMTRFSARYVDRIDVRAFGPGERITFLPYTKETYLRSQEWMQQREMFPESDARLSYEQAVLV